MTWLRLAQQTSRAVTSLLFGALVIGAALGFGHLLLCWVEGW